MPALTYVYGATIGIGGIFGYLAKCFSRPPWTPLPENPFASTTLHSEEIFFRQRCSNVLD
jgi:hypothetical protein